MAANAEESSDAVENLYLDILRELKSHVTLPIVMKLSSQFSSPIHFAKRLEAGGADGIALFNRFYQPDIDLETLEVLPKLELSSSSEALLRIRWTALLYGRTQAFPGSNRRFSRDPGCDQSAVSGRRCGAPLQRVTQAGRRPV
jgi:dihydroorotate dehydrogenase (fumarate)